VDRWRATWERSDDLQRGPTTLSDEREIVRLLESMTSAERRLVLRRIDANSDYHDLDELVFHDVDDPALRQRLLATIAEAGSRETELAIISDYDDTVVPHKDRRWGEAFPGAKELYAALEGDEPGDVHYVTARPSIATSNVKEHVAERGLPAGTLEEGSLDRWFWKGLDGARDEKIEDIERLLQLHPGQRFVLIGDDSQRDPEVYATIRERHPDRVAEVIIRRTGHAHEAEREGLLYVDTYEQALQTPSVKALIAGQPPG